MAGTFDPYHRWLGIPKGEQPPNHYRLLGVQAFETDPDVIDAAADRQMAYLHQCGTGEHAALSQKLLNEVSVARLCLLSPAKRAVYDKKLEAALQAAKPSVDDAVLLEVAPAIDLSVDPADSISDRMRPRRRRASRPVDKRWIIGLAVAGGILTSILVVLLLGRSGNRPSVEQAQAKETESQPESTSGSSSTPATAQVTTDQAAKPTVTPTPDPLQSAKTSSSDLKPEPKVANTAESVIARGSGPSSAVKQTPVVSGSALPVNDPFHLIQKGEQSNSQRLTPSVSDPFKDKGATLQRLTTDKSEPVDGSKSSVNPQTASATPQSEMSKPSEPTPETADSTPADAKRSTSKAQPSASSTRSKAKKPLGAKGVKGSAPLGIGHDGVPRKPYVVEQTPAGVPIPVIEYRGSTPIQNNELVQVGIRNWWMYPDPWLKAHRVQFTMSRPVQTFGPTPATDVDYLLNATTRFDLFSTGDETRLLFSVDGLPCQSNSIQIPPAPNLAESSDRHIATNWPALGVNAELRVIDPLRIVPYGGPVPSTPFYVIGLQFAAQSSTLPQAEWGHLRKLYFPTRMHLLKDSFSEFSALPPNLPTLEVEGPITDAQADGLPAVWGLTSLEARGGISSKAFQALQALDYLHRLRIKDTQFTAADMAVLGKMHIRYLTLENCKFPAAPTKKPKTFPTPVHLKHLVLYDTPMLDEWFDMPGVEGLVVAGPDFTERHLEKVRQSPTLKLFVVRNSRIPESRILKLKADLPNCEIRVEDPVQP